MVIDTNKFQFVELNSTYILKGARLKYTLLPLIFYYVFIKRSFKHTNTYLIQRFILNKLLRASAQKSRVSSIIVPYTI